MRPHLTFFEMPQGSLEHFFFRRQVTTTTATAAAAANTIRIRRLLKCKQVSALAISKAVVPPYLSDYRDRNNDRFVRTGAVRHTSSNRISCKIKILGIIRLFWLSFCRNRPWNPPFSLLLSCRQHHHYHAHISIHILFGWNHIERIALFSCLSACLHRQWR
jgi:hypothetical protein